MHIEINRDVCVGAGNCVMTVDEVFDQDADGLVELHQADPSAEFADRVTLAARLCPSGAITVHQVQPR